MNAASSTATFDGAALRLRMLVVDDDDVDRERVRRLLQRSLLEADVTEASSARQALLLVRAQAFDCVVLDNHLGDGSGAELLPELRRESMQDCPFIMVTGAGSEALAVQVLRDGAADYLTKPTLSVEGLQQSILRSLEHHRVRRELDELHLQLEQRVQEQAHTIRQSERDLRALLDNAPAALGYWDRDERCRWGNHAHGDWFGVDAQQLPGLHLREVVGAPLHATIETSVQAALAGTAQQVELTLPARGTKPLRHAQLDLRPDIADDGAVIGFYAALTDVTPIKLAQARAEELLHFSETVIDTCPVGIAVFRADGACVLSNAALAETFDARSVPTGGTLDLSAWSPADLMEGVRHTLDDGRVRRIDIARPTGDGLSHVACAIARVEHRGEPHLLLIAQDITERRRAHEALIAARDAAESAARTKSAFLSNMSHEIRTPMNAIVGLSRLALEDELPVTAREFLDKVHTAAVALMGILDDVLDYAKIESGHLHFEHIRFDLDDLLQRVVDLFQARTEQKGLAFSIDVDPVLPASLVGDPLRLSQVLTNLVGNAVKFTDSGRIHLSARLMSSPAAGRLGQVRFEVIDTGLGIDAARRSSLFEAFVQGDASITRQFGGTGLGLAICRRLVRAMDGEIGVDSEPGQGSTFWFDARLAPDDPRPTLTSAAVAGHRLLVLDAQPWTRESIERQLRYWRADVVAVDALPQALAYLRAAAAAGTPVGTVLVDRATVGALGDAGAQQLRDAAAGAPPRVLVMARAGDRTSLSGATGAVAPEPLLVQPVLPSRLLEALSRPRAGARPAPLQPLGATGADRSPPTAQQARSDALRTLAAPLRGRRVLLAEDNLLNQVVASEMLHRMGLQVSIVVDGEQALAALRQAPQGWFDLVLMDLHMPVLDGLEATRRMRAIPAGAELPIVGMTAAALPEDRARCIEAGMVDHIPKPVIPEQMVQTLLRWLPRPPENPPTLDLPALRSRLHGNEPLLWRVLRVFVQNEAGAWDTLATAIANGETEPARRKAHDLKGSAANLGAMALSDAAGRLEQALAKGTEATEALASLKIRLDEGLGAIRAALATRADDPS